MVCLSLISKMKVIKTVVGKVVRGTSQGKKIGFPTVNIMTDAIELPFGVYAARVATPFGVYKGALHYGPRQILNLPEPLLEVHLLDFSGDLYDEEVKIEILSKIRDTQDFLTMEALQQQISLDIEEVRKLSIQL